MTTPFQTEEDLMLKLVYGSKIRSCNFPPDMFIYMDERTQIKWNDGSSYDAGFDDLENWSEITEPSDLRTSKEWKAELCLKQVFLDVNGWDATNFNYSFHEEKITKEEFYKRKAKSTMGGMIL